MEHSVLYGLFRPSLSLGVLTSYIVSPSIIIPPLQPTGTPFHFLPPLVKRIPGKRRGMEEERRGLGKGCCI